MSYDRLPDQITGPMTANQARTLRSLAVEAYQERLFQPNLSRAEADQEDRAPAAGDQPGEFFLTAILSSPRMLRC
jgi:hypothetical protein